MLTINKQDIFKTIIIIWFIATTSYVAYDQYSDYKIKGIQAAYQSGYGAAIDDLINKSKESQCQSFEVAKDSDKVSLVNTDCLKQTEATQPTQPAKK
jgi:hypothetical protein